MAPLFHLLLTLISAWLVAASPSNVVHDVAPSAMLRAPDFDLDGDFVRGGISDNLKQSLSLIEKAETLPSCGKIATSALLHSCSALEGSVVHDSPLPLGSDLLIEEESDIYAARLAVCELSGADYAVPTECHSFLPKPNAKKTQSVKGWWNKNGPTKPRVANDYFDEVTAANLKQCRKALGSSSQAWTSYSNSRQNAVAMCHAMQSAVERDESRHIAEILAKTAAASAESLKDADERAQEIKQLFHELRTGMPQFQKDLAAFDANIQQRVQDYWDELGRAQISLEGLTAVMNHNHNDMKEMHAHLQEILGNIIPEMALAIANASQQAKDTGTNAVSTSELVAYHMERTQQSFIEKMATAGYELGAINDLVPRLNTVMQSTIDNTMRSLEVATLKQQEFALAQNASIEDVQRHREELASLGAELREARREARDARAAWKELLSLRGLLAAMGFANENEFVAPCATILGLLSGLLWRRRCSTTELILAVIVTMMVITYVLNLLIRWAMPYYDFGFRLVPEYETVRSIIIPFGVCSVMVLLVAAMTYGLRPSRKSSQADDDYDPLSPPSGAGAWFVWLREATLDRITFRRHRPSALSKSRV